MSVNVSIAVPSRNEIFLRHTIIDILKNATTDIEVFPILDGYEPPEEELVIDPRVTYIRLEKQKYLQKRHGVNQALAMSTGKHVMSVDAHCMFAPGFDKVLTECHSEENLIQIPRRNRLDAENWRLQPNDRPPIDYEYTMWPKKFDPIAFHGFRWDARTLERWDTPIDDTMIFQGSCWFMTKSYFNKMGFMQIEGFTGWGQEAEEFSFSTWMTGGRVVTNKYTWYAHLHKGEKYGRMYFMSKNENRASYVYSYDKFINGKVNNKIHNFDWIVEKFWPLPGWPNNWKEELGL